MVWVQIDDAFDEHPKVSRLGDAAFRAFVEGLCYCNRNLTDGRINRGIARLRGWTRRARELVEAGLWEADADGWLIHDYPQYQPSREEVLAIREERHEARSRAGRMGAAARWQRDGKPHGKPMAKRMATAWQTDGPVPDPVPISPPAIAEGEKRARAEAPEPENAEGDEPASEDRDMRETLLQALPMKFRWEADVRDDIDQFVADFAGRFAEVTAAVAACRREREIPFPRNLRGHLPALPGGSNHGGKHGRNGARNGRAAAPELCPCGSTRWSECGKLAGYCEQCRTQEPISETMLARLGRLEG